MVIKNVSLDTVIGVTSKIPQMDKPEIAFAIRIANGYSSTFASEVGNDVLEYYYGVTDASELITGKATTIAASTHGD